MKFKKIIPAVVALCAVAMLGGCKKTEETEYDKLNAMLGLNYSKIVLTVTDTFDEDTVLVSEYTMKFSGSVTAVSYTVEKFAELSLDATASAKTTLTGEAKIADGKVFFGQGDEVDLSAITEGTGLDFQERYLTNTELTDSSFKADVTNPSGFMGSTVICTGMKVKTIFFDAFHSIQINYTAANGNSVEYLYKFSV